MASEIRPGNASKASAAWICALLIVFVQLSGVNCGETAAERQRTLELGIPSSDPTYAGPMPLGHEIASSSHASSRRGGGRRELMGGELAGVIVGSPPWPIAAAAKFLFCKPRPSETRGSGTLRLALRNGFWLACMSVIFLLPNRLALLALWV